MKSVTVIIFCLNSNVAACMAVIRQFTGEIIFQQYNVPGKLLYWG